MTAKKIVENAYVISLGFVNVFLIDLDGLTLIDAGIAGSDQKILDAVRGLGKQPGDIRQILVTHLHADHTGGLAAIQKASGAPVYMNELDADLLRQGIGGRAFVAPPSGIGKLLSSFIVRPNAKPSHVEPVEVAHLISGDTPQVLPIAGGIQAVRIPGHTAGHTVFLWPQHGGVLFVGDALTRMLGILGHPPVYEDVALGQQSLKKLLELEYDSICFSHGSPMVGRAAEKLRGKILQLATP